MQKLPITVTGNDRLLRQIVTLNEEGTLTFNEVTITGFVSSVGRVTYTEAQNEAFLSQVNEVFAFDQFISVESVLKTYHIEHRKYSSKLMFKCRKKGSKKCCYIRVHKSQHKYGGGVRCLQITDHRLKILSTVNIAV